MAITVEQVAGRVPVVAGAGSNDTRRAIAQSRDMQAAGATHLAARDADVQQAAATRLGRALSGHRGRGRGCRSSCTTSRAARASTWNAATTLELAEVPGIVGIKEASGDLAQITEIIAGAPADFSVLSGDDALALAVVAAGGDGVISVTSNATPKRMAALVARRARRRSGGGAG